MPSSQEFNQKNTIKPDEGQPIEFKHKRSKEIRFGRKALTFLLGLAVISGVIFVSYYCIRTVYRDIRNIFTSNNNFVDTNAIISRTNQATPNSKEFFEDMFKNIVRSNIEAFDNADDIPEEKLLTFGIWQAMDYNEEAQKYKTDMFGRIIIPKNDVEKGIKTLLHYTKSIKHKSVSVFGKFNYSGIQNGYSVEITTIDTEPLVPYVKDIKNQDKNFTVIVDYIKESTLAVNSGETPKSEKTFTFNIEQISEKEYYILSIKPN